MNSSTNLKTLQIDGRIGEGGGQVLRTSLGLSMATGRPFELSHIRGGRPKPGLMRQHLACVRACAALCQAEVSGDTIGSQSLFFRPKAIQSGQIKIDIGSAGSTTMVAQAVLPALLLATQPMSITVTGGTHNDKAPPADFLIHSLCPLLKKMGAPIEASCEKYGFFPAGGGELHVQSQGQSVLRGMDLMTRGEAKSVEAVSYVANLSFDIAKTECQEACKQLGWCESVMKPMTVDGPGPGNALALVHRAECVTEVIGMAGRIGVSASQVAKRAAKQMHAYLRSDAAVSLFLADQLLVPAALVAWKSNDTVRYTTHRWTLHARTQQELIPLWLPVAVDTSEDKGITTIQVKSR